MNKYLALLLCLLLPLPAVASQFDGIYAFGDSLTDTHNQFNAYGTPGYPYFDGRYSNGPLWVEDLAPKLGLTFNPATDYAVAGATSGTLNYDSVNGHAPLAGIQTQISNYLAQNPVADPNGLYIVWGGADDYLGAIQASLESTGAAPNPFQLLVLVAKTLGNLDRDISALAEHGAHNFLIPDLANLGALPASQAAVVAYDLPLLPLEANLLTSSHDLGLVVLLDALQARFPNDHFTLLDVYGEFDQITADPGAYGFANVTGDYLDYAIANPGTTVNPNSFLFFDELHPTAAGHAVIADAAYAALLF